MSSELATEPGLSFEMVLAAVQESSRGRWFLDEFRARNAAADFKTILDAIARLETRLNAMSGGVTAGSEVIRIKEAIAATRREIMQSAGAPGLSDEAKLFAHLADLARSALSKDQSSTPAQMPTGIVHALRLVDNIEKVLGGVPHSEDHFFRRDQDIFEETLEPPKAAKSAAPVSASAPVPSKPEPFSQPPEKADAPQLGAKLVISRTSRNDKTPAVDAASAAAVEPAAAPSAAEAEPVVGESEHRQSPRIVIIRRKPEEMREVSPALDAAAQPTVETAA